MSQIRFRWAIALIALFLVFDLILAFYHSTHGGGWRSGVTELCFAILVGTLVFQAFKARGRGLIVKYRRYSIALRIINSIIAVILIFLSIYHFTHDGLRSGIIESTLAVVLAIIAYLIA